MLQEELSLSPHAGHSRDEGQHVAAARPARAEATRLADEAAHGLARNRPDLSAHIVITVPQKLALAALLGVAAGLALVLPMTAWVMLADLLSLMFLIGAMFRAALALLGGPPPRGNADACNETLPVYTLIVPLCREANVLPRLARTLLLLDYPRDRLDVKFVVEADDLETVAVAEELEGRGPFEVIRVPEGHPRTKPRACNYALNFARGEFTVIYDAEDRPERDQLRKAVAAFRASRANIACLQARLNFFNARENALTKLFALDYALWFDVLLPALDRLGVPMPLGGTSNHFRTAVLRKLGGWDPFNVTEDADLGIRIAQLGMRVAMLDSTTFEEAPVRLGVWLRQRSRWMKGYMQTWLVHTRQPFALVRRTGARGFLAFHLFIGGSVAAALATMPLWLIFLLSATISQEGPTATSLSMLATGNLLLTALAIASPTRRGWQNLAPYGLAVPLYWAMISVAAWRGLGQLVTRPFHWEKTPHGLSRQ
jgi:cellulose synthase/poly-beta-1,6-N-acetylglucosamine synthase-like glycosyltransferase